MERETDDDAPCKENKPMLQQPQHLMKHKNPWLDRHNRRTLDHSDDDDVDQKIEMANNHDGQLNHEDGDDDDHAKMR